MSRDLIKSEREKIINQIFVILNILLGLAGLVLLVIRIQYGIDFSDESWYVAEPYIVANGATPYVDLWQQAPGFTIPLAIIYKMYIVFNGTEGIFLFSRIIFCAFSFLISLISMNLLGEKSHYCVLGLLFPLLLVNNGTYDVTYNTIGLYYILLSSSVLFANYKTRGREYIGSFFSGVVIARSVIGTPASAGAVIVCLLLLLEKKHYRKLVFYCAGGAFFVVTVSCWILVKNHDLYYVIEGVHSCFSTNLYLKISRTDSINSNLYYLLRFLTPFFFSLAAICVFCLVNKCFKERIVRYFSPFVNIVVFILICLAFYKYYRTNEYLTIIKYTWFIVFINTFKNKSEFNKTLSHISLAYCATYFLVGLTNIHGFTDARMYWLWIPCLLGILSIQLLDERSYFDRILMLILVLFIGIIFVIKTYGFVYRDSDIAFLDQRVERGVWKGCITTSERVKMVDNMESFIRNNTDDADDVLCLDWASFGYLMTDSNRCTPTTLDPMTYSYGTNDDTIMREYYELTQKYPDKIIYIDYGRDRKLSIEDETWIFSSYVVNNYVLIDKMEFDYNDAIYSENEKYRILIYERQ